MSVAVFPVVLVLTPCATLFVLAVYCMLSVWITGEPVPAGSWPMGEGRTCQTGKIPLRQWLVKSEPKNSNSPKSTRAGTREGVLLMLEPELWIGRVATWMSQFETKMAGTCTSDDHAQWEYNSYKLLLNLLAAILFPKSLDLALLSLYSALSTSP